MLHELIQLTQDHSATIEVIGENLFISSNANSDLSAVISRLRPYKAAIIKLASQKGNGKLFRIGPPAITPDLLPLVALTQEQIDGIVEGVPGGSSNVQDIYPLAPLQEGILFHHLMAREGDLYLLWSQMSFPDRDKLDGYVTALNAVIARHDILRTAVVHEGLPEAVQVVWRNAPVVVEEVRLDPGEGDISGQLKRRFDPRHYRLDVRQAPLQRLFIAHDAAQDRWVMMCLFHHLSTDHTTMEVIQEEIRAHLAGQTSDLPAARPFRNFVAQARLGVSRREHEAFFGKMLGDVDEPTAPFGLMDVRGDGLGVGEARLMLDAALAMRLRTRARALGVSAASLFHVAWGLVLSRSSGQQDPVFGTVLFGRMQGGEGTDRVLGLFINTLPVRLRLGEIGAEQSVLETHRLLAELLRHEHAALVLAQRCSGVPAPAPLFTALLNYRHSALPSEKGTAQSRAIEGIKGLGGEERTNYPVTLSVDDLGKGFGLVAQTVSSLDPKRLCAMMKCALEQLVEALELNPSQPVGRLDVLPPEERHKLLVEWNDTDAEYPKDLCIHELFEAQVERDASATAVVYEETSLTYGDLNEKANRLAHHLRTLGVRPDSRVAICVERSLEMVVGLLAILKAGGAYVPLDPAYPPERLGYMLKDGDPVIVLTHAAARANLDQALAQAGAGANPHTLSDPVLTGSGKIGSAPSFDQSDVVSSLRDPNFPAQALSIPILDLEADIDDWAISPATNPDPKAVGLTPHNLAYIIYTSGSTGQPKGVMVEHGGVVNYLVWIQQAYRLKTGRGAPINTSYAFDATVTSFWGPLVSGGMITLFPEREDELVALGEILIRRDNYSLVKLTPSHLDILQKQNPGGARDGSALAFVIGGEVLTTRQVAFWRKHAPSIRLINEYGPTEATVGMIVYEVATVLPSNGNVPIGRPISNTRIYLLDGLGSPVPEGVCGEIYIGGAGVARGYWNRPELTSERFIESRFVAGDRLYRTGDLGRYLPDGNIEFLGRNDHQVKIRGFRIELGEIEARLLSHPGVGEAVVLAREDEAGDKRLVGYYTTVAGVWAGLDGADGPDAGAAASIGAEELRAYLSLSFPDYMVPAAYVRLDALPLTPNGKLDRKALPAPDGSAYGRGGYEAPVGPVETTLAAIWSEVLGIERVGRRDSFFGLGGHSLLAIRVLERMRRAGLEGDIRALFTTPVLCELAGAVGEGRLVAPPITQVDRDGLLVPSFAQQRLWFLSQLEGVSEAYHISLGLRLRGALDEAALLRALDRLVARHETLRTSFFTIDGDIYQRIGPEDMGFDLRRLDLRGVGDSKDRLFSQIGEEGSASFDLERGPPIRGRLIRLGDEEHVLLVTMHHIVSDGWSMGVLTRELSSLYRAYSLGEEDPLAPLTIQYADYAAWQRQWLSGEVLAEQSAYWQRTLSDAPALLELPIDRRRPAVQDFSGGTVVLQLDETLTAGLTALSQRYGLTLFMTVLAGWALVLSRLSNQEDIVIGTPSANRGRLEIEGLIGFFVNTLALRIDLSGTPTVKALLERVKATALDAQTHQGLPFEQVVDLVKPVRSLSHTPVFQVMFAWQNNEGGALDLPGLTVTEVRGVQAAAKFDLTLELRESNGRIVGNLNYATALFDQKTIERWAGYLRETLSQMVADAQQMAAAIPILPPEERHKLLVEWNDTDAEYPKDLCIHELFEAQVERDASATAVVYEETSLTYGDLNEKANRLAHHLRTLGVRPDSRVAICVERSLEMVVGLLAILKAGGAYVPLDPAYPPERLGYMLKDGDPVIVLTHAAARANLDQALAQAGAGANPHTLSDPVLTGSGKIGSAPSFDQSDVVSSLRDPDFPAQALSIPILDLEADIDDWAISPATNPDPKAVGLTPHNLAYIIYTSGSTGQPKGVMVEHGNTNNLLSWAQGSFGQADLKRTLFSTSLNFDLAVFECFVPLTGGHITEVIRDILDLSISPDSTLINSVPSAVTAVVDKIAFSNIRVVNVAGEPLKRSLVESIFNLSAAKSVCNLYGPTETTTYSTFVRMVRDIGFNASIGRPISNTRIYLLDGLGSPVPEGVCGEIYIGGAGVARGYWNRPELTSERFIESRFVAGDRLYRTGDLGRYLPDGNIEFLGRNDHQVKIRGFRIELGEIEARLLSHPGVGEAVVLAREDEAGDKRLVGYYTTVAGVWAGLDGADGPDAGAAASIGAEELRAYLSLSFPDYMVPAAYVRLDALPLTPNGKLDRKALPAPDGSAYGRGGYEAPVGPVETTLAAIWSEVLGIERVGRRDSFFGLGGHSLLAIRVLERMRRAGLEGDIRALFTTPVLCELAGAVGTGSDLVEVPANRIEPGCARITPDLLPLVALTQEQIDGIVEGVPGGSSNVQDIYPLAPLQEGILFHHLMAREGDPYLLWSQMSFPDRDKLDGYVTALNAVIARHDILRTAVVHEGLPEAVQVVWRNAPVVVEEVRLDPGEGDISGQLKRRFDPRHYRLDVRQAPLQRLFIAHDAAQDRWVMMCLFHHLSTDHTTMEVIQEEIRAHLAGQTSDLPAARPFRNFVAQARLGVSRREHEAFFGKMLGDVDEPTAPFGLMDVRGDGLGVGEARLMLDAALAMRLRTRARALGVSAASLFHVAWGLVLSRSSGQQDPVFGTVLFGRMQGGEGTDRVLGLFINTLPVRLRLGEIGAEQSVLETHRLLAELLRHEHAALVLAQRCSGVPAPAPLFTALLNYRHSALPSEKGTAQSRAIEGIKGLGGEERTNYPVTLSVDDLGKGFGLVAQTVSSLDPKRLCAMMKCALEQLVEALELNPSQPVGRLDVLPPEERHKLLVEWNDTDAEYPKDLCIHELFEAQVERDASATAVVYEETSLTYGDLNEKANRLAHHLRTLGVRPDSRVAICVERSLEMVVGLLAILKAGGAYVPLDPAYPPERLGYMLKDGDPVIVLTHAAARANLDQALAQAGAGANPHTLSDPVLTGSGKIGSAPSFDQSDVVSSLRDPDFPAQALSIPILDLEADIDDWAISPATNPDPKAVGLTPHNLAYIIYTSGSTGQPKGVMVEHGHFTLTLHAAALELGVGVDDVLPNLASTVFDIALLELLLPLIRGGSTRLLDTHGFKEFDYLIAQTRTATFLHAVPSLMEAWLNHLGAEGLTDRYPALRGLLVGGEAVPKKLLERLSQFRDVRVVEFYGPTEATVVSTSFRILPNNPSPTPYCIGRPISNTRIYLLDGLGSPVPEGVCGEIYIGGAGVARGYWNRPELTSERFIESRFVAGDRLYRTGDLGRYLPDGNIEFLGRNDHQVKIRGFRIELGEIEARLLSHPGVGEAVVLAREDEAGDKRLVGYYTTVAGVWAGLDGADGPDAGAAASIGAEELRAYLSLSFPDYMVPAAYVRLDALPLTPNGKLDRKALPAPDGSAYGRGGYEAPVGPVETTLAAIWSEVLGIERVGRRDSFFGLGGHSLLAIRVLERMRRAGLEGDIRALFTTPVLCELAGAVGEGRLVVPPITQVDRDGLLVPSFAQQRLWFLSQLEGVSEAYHISLGLRLRGALDEAALLRALDRLVARHETLRTSFFTIDGDIYQRIGPEDMGFDLRRLDLRGVGDSKDRLFSQIGEEGSASFDLERGPPIRGRLIRLGDEEHVLLVTMHHIVSDGWSMGVLTRELSSLYRAYSLGEEDPLAPLTIQYADYAAWQRQWLSGEVLAEQSAYWQRTLSDAPALLELPIDRRRPAVQDFSGGTVVLQLDETLTAGLTALSQRYGLTLFMTVLAGWALVLSRLSNQEDIVIGTPSANRGRLEIEGLIGFFVNTLALRIDLSGTPTVKALLERVKATALDAQTHQGLPFEQVVDLVKPVRSLSHTPVFQVMFAWQNNEGGALDLPGLEVAGVRGGRPVAKFDLTLELRESNGRIVGNLNYATALFDQKTIERWAGYLRETLSQMVADAQQMAAAIPILPPEERHKLLVEWNDTDAEYPKDLCIHELFEAQVERDASATAVVYEETSLTYGDLNEKANRLAHHLRTLGVRPDSRVAICVERSLEMVVGLLAILKAGGAYVPLDPAYPPERLGYMLKDGDPVIVLTHAAARANLDQALAQAGAGANPHTLSDPVLTGSGKIGSAPSFDQSDVVSSLRDPNFPAQALSIPILDLEADIDDWAISPATNPDPKAVGLTPHNLAYIIYTSGSTGQPKGVMVEHGNITRLFAATQAWFHFDHQDVWTLFHSFAFDFSVWEIWGALLHGGRLIVVPQITARSPSDFYQLLCDHGVTILNQTPGAFHNLIAVQAHRKDAHRLRSVIFGGEALEVATLYPWYQNEQNHQTNLVNMYGITETTVHVTYRPLEAADVGHLINGSPIGRRIPDLRIYLLDGLGSPVPEGVCGEIYIGGAGVARGYWNRPELTSERFIESRFVAGDRLYRTGDLGRYLPDGNIEFLGRNDHQVKIRGFRIELGEIEARLLSHPGVGEAVVLAREDEAGDKRLVGYYTTVAGVWAGLDGADGPDAGAAASIGAEELRAYLSLSFPDYMVPAAYVRLDALPLTPNGKLDRKALPAPDGSAYGRGGYEAPVGPVETTLAAIWSEVLGIERVGRRDSFFGLGGHSLLAIRVLERMRRAGLEGDIRALFTTPVLCELAGAVGEGRLVVPPITQVDRDGLLVPSFAQQRLWFLSQLEGVSEAYHISLGLRLRGALDEAALLRALDRLVARHETLRTSFFTIDGDIYQRIGPEDMGFDLRRLDLRGVGDSKDRLFSQIGEEGSASFDLERGPPIRGRLIRLGDEEHVLLVTMHHIVSDGWSMGVLTRELSSLYRAYSLGEEDPLAPLTIQYADYAAWQRQWLSGEVLAEQSAYWQRTLSDAPALLELPIDRRRPAVQDFSGGTVVLQLDETLTAGLTALSQRYGLTLFMTVLAGWALVLSRLSNQEDIVIGTPSANRGRLEIEGLIGFFVNTLALRIDLSGTPTVKALLERVKATALDAQTHQGLPFEQVVDLVKPVRSLSHTPVFQVMFAWQNNEGGALDLPGLEVAGVRGGRPVAKFDLTLELRESNGRIVGNLNYATALFDQKTIERWAGYLRETLSQMVADAQQMAAAIPILPPEERHKLLVEWNDTDAEYPKDLCIHELFEAQVERDASATAVVYEETSLTYGDLNEKANRLAHHLRTLGVRPDSRVAICVERSLEMVVGLLAILKAGGAYVPLDPAYPPERLGYMLKDGDPVIVLTHAAARANLDQALAQAGAGANPHTLSDPVLTGSGKIGSAPSFDQSDVVSSLRDPDFPAQALSIPILDLEADIDDWAISPATNPDPKAVGLTPHNLAYIIYTSGSTGQPKGVEIAHRSILRLLINNGFIDLGFEDNIAFTSNPAFDASTLELWAALLFGGKLIVFSRPDVLDQNRFRRLLKQKKVSCLWMTAGLFSKYACDLASVLSQLKYLIVGGDIINPQAAAEILCQKNAIHFINGYGPTESTTFATTHEITEQSFLSGSIPIGRPISNTRIYLLDGLGSPVPEGVCGEIYIGGAGVARGYWNRPELTSERFIESRFVAGDRLYRTGDLGRYLPDGNIEFLGRNDHQVKIRGFRIELGEIEARLLSHPGVGEAVVLAREDEAGDKRLVGYYTTVAGVWAGLDGADGPDAGAAASIGAEELRAYLSLSFPDYMVPAAYVRLDALPLTPNGKLDRKALPAPDGSAYGRGGYEAPVGPVETTLAAIWSEVLGIERVGRRDSFFGLGGHSLLAIRVLERMRRIFGRETSLQQLLELNTLTALARHVVAQASILATRDITNCHEDSPVILIKQGSGPPIFLFHPMGGAVDCYSELVDLLHEDVTVYGIHAFSDELKDAITIAEIASIYSSHIMRIQPEGPYRFLGFSFGGLIATQVAQKFIHEKRLVALLALIDATLITQNPDSSPRPDRWAAFIGLYFGHLDAKRICTSSDDENRFSTLRLMLKKSKEFYYTIEDLKRLYCVFHRHDLILEAYKHIAYSGVSVSYIATSPESGPSQAAVKIDKLHEFWKSIEILEINASHSAIMKGESVKLVASDLNRRLRAT